MDSSYQPESVISHFNQFAEQEWERLIRSPIDEVSLHIHTHYLKKHISPNQEVLEIGAGAGRFTQILAELQAQTLVADISNVQLKLNKKFAAEYHFESAVTDWRQVDICDLSAFEPNSFDAVVAYGGPFSYVLDKKDQALAETLRVLKPGGMLLLSVMSLWGTIHRFMEGVLEIQSATNKKIVETSDLTPATYPERQGNFMHMFRADELRSWLENAGLTIVDISASNALSIGANENLPEIRNSPEKWAELLRLELDACQDKGCIGMGTHMIAVVQKPL